MSLATAQYSTFGASQDDDPRSAFIAAPPAARQVLPQENVPAQKPTSLSMHGDLVMPGPLLFSVHHQPELSGKLVNEFRQMERLERGWDGDEAEPIPGAVTRSARALLLSLLQTSKSLREPTVLPTVDGSVQLEWHDKDRTLEFDFTGVRWVALGVEVVSGHAVKRHTAVIGNDDYALAAGCYAWFVRRDPRRAAWPSR